MVDLFVIHLNGNHTVVAEEIKKCRVEAVGRRNGPEDRQKNSYVGRHTGLVIRISE